jgi:hypothetical protein
MGNAGQNDALDIGEDPVERFALLRRVLRQLRTNLSRLHARENREAFDPGIVVRDPVHDRVALAAEFVGRHVERLWVGHSDDCLIVDF